MIAVLAREGRRALGVRVRVGEVSVLQRDVCRAVGDRRADVQVGDGFACRERARDRRVRVVATIGPGVRRRERTHRERLARGRRERRRERFEFFDGVGAIAAQEVDGVRERHERLLRVVRDRDRVLEPGFGDVVPPAIRLVGRLEREREGGASPLVRGERRDRRRDDIRRTAVE